MTNGQIERTNPDQEVSSDKLSIMQPNEIVKFDPEADIKQGQKAAKALMQLIKLTKPLKLGGKDYLYFEHWITIARFFNATVGIEWTKKTATGWEAKAIVYQNGQMIGSAEAACNDDEANWKNKPDFQRKSMSQTRACSKALRQIFGYIPVLVGISATPAEEMNGDGKYDKVIETPTTDGKEYVDPNQRPSALVKPNSSVSQAIATDYECPVHGNTVSLRPAGITKQGKKYGAFHACNEKIDGKFCKERPEKVIQVEEVATIEIEPVEESSVDKARRILNEKVPYKANHEGD